MEIECPDYIEIGKNFNFTVNYISNAEIDIEIKFDDSQEKKTLVPNSTNYFAMTFLNSNSSFMKFVIDSLNSSLKIYPLIYGKNYFKILSKNVLDNFKKNALKMKSWVFEEIKWFFLIF